MSNSSTVVRSLARASCRAQSAPAPDDADCRLPHLCVSYSQSCATRGKLPLPACWLWLMIKCNQSINRSRRPHRTTPNATVRRTSLHPPRCPLSRLLPSIVACAHPSSIVRRRRPPSPHGAAFWKPFVCPPSIHPVNSGLPTQAHRAGAIALAPRHPPTRKLVVSAGIKPSLQQHAPPPTGGTLEAEQRERERTSSTTDAPCSTSPLSHLHPSLHHQPPHHSTTHPLRVAVHRRLSTVEAPVPPPHTPCATALGAL